MQNKEITPATVYRVNRNNVITGVNEAFLEFARENNSSLTDIDDYRGKLLDPFINGKETKMLISELFEHVRQSGKASTVKYRCDSPETIREFSLCMEPYPNGDLELRSALTYVEQRMPICILDVNSEHSDSIVKMCSWCKKIAAQGNRYDDLDQAIRKWDLLLKSPPPQISHTICPSCSHSVMEEWERNAS